MSSIYSPEHRALQEEFNTTKLAELLDNGWIHEKISPEEAAFIASRDMFFLSTVDPDGSPTVSYKGGPVGMVKVLDESTLVFPGYDGNGMFYSVGNIVGQGKVGMLFIDFETPHRVRVQGNAKLVREHALMAEYAEAQYLIFVEVTKIWVNCPRYIHKYKRVETSKYVPKVCDITPIPTWKRLDMVQDAITPEERALAEQQGLVDLAEYEEKVKRGEG
ncbi:MAG TPA: pyridoxamine 5'-phosphate oxidase family protein [Methylophilaceae bacterium]|nr:pyridoxamine 5'-phosphate oxidase family protein [Methylophilaceae bacterium]